MISALVAKWQGDPAARVYRAELEMALSEQRLEWLNEARELMSVQQCTHDEQVQNRQAACTRIVLASEL